MPFSARVSRRTLVRGERTPVKKIAYTHHGDDRCDTHRDFRELLNRKDIDAVFIPTGPNWHGTTAMHAARAGRLGKFKRVYAHPAGMKAFSSGCLPEEPPPPAAATDWDMYLGTAAWRPFNGELLDGFNFEKGGGLVGVGGLEWGTHCVDFCRWAVGASAPRPSANSDGYKKGITHMHRFLKSPNNPVRAGFHSRLLAAVLLSLASVAASAAELRSFDKQTLTERFVAEGCALADFDHDGHVDLTAGNSIWYGPEFTQRVDFTPPAHNPAGMTKTPYDPASGYSDYFLAFAHDFTGDSWADILVYGLPGEPAYVFVNPAGKAPEGEEVHWEKHAIFDTADGESPDLIDVIGDGKPELLVHAGGQLGYAEIDWSQPLAKARFHPITPKTPENDKKYFRYTHGSGAGDVNGDGRIDLLVKDGWFEHPAADAASLLWPFHPGPFGPEGARGGGQMYVYDVNGDGRNDVITSYDGHGYGLGWFEQRTDGGFTEHRIMGATAADHPHGVAFSQIHALRVVDFDGDGLLDILTGKRRWAHGIKGDPEPNAPPVLYWFRLTRDGKGSASYEPREIDADSGVGTQVTAGDVNKDGKPDVVVANKRGVFIFRQTNR